MDTEEENKRFLLMARRWVELYKNDIASLIYSPDGQNLIEELLEKKEELKNHLILLRTWLASHVCMFLFIF